MSNETLYRESLLERLENPINQGRLKDPDKQARLVNPLCGDEVLLELKVRNNRIEQAVYSGNGCALSQVSASFTAEMVTGKSLEEVKRIKNNIILKKFGGEVSPSRLKCALLSVEVLKEILTKE